MADDHIFRRGTIDDSYTVFRLFENSFADLSQRLGFARLTSATDPEMLAKMWEERRSLYFHLAETAEHFWLAERDGRVRGFSRSILRDGLLELTELFILPGDQSAGLGRALLERAFPESGTEHRLIIASPDLRGQALYLKAGLEIRFPLYYFWRKPEAVTFESDLSFEPISASAANLADLGEIDTTVLGHRRDADHAWLLSDRQGILYRRGNRPVGYGYAGKRSGPFALLNSDDFPVVLAHAESQAAAGGWDHFGLEIPMVNKEAVTYLLSRGFQIEEFIAQLLTDTGFGRFENYIVTSPPLFL